MYIMSVNWIIGLFDERVNTKMQINVIDRQTYAIDSQRVYTDEGFLRVPGRASRTGIQTYLASELGLPDDPNRPVNIYRPADEVFNADSLQSFLGIDLTNDHPNELVNPDNYRSTTVGTVISAGRQDDDHVIVDMVIKDRSAIRAVESGKAQLSVGYKATYDNTPGVTADGIEYEFVQRGIKCNHLAICYNGRAGTARIFDHQTGGISMPVLIVTDSGRSIDVADAANAQVVADAFDRLNKRVTDAETAKETVTAQLDAVKEQVEELKVKCSDEAIKSRVESIAKVTVAARKIAGESFSTDSVDPIEIQRAALAVKRPKMSWVDKSPTYVQVAFDEAVEKGEEEEEEGKTSKDQFQQLAKDAAGTATTTTTADATPVLSRAQMALKNQMKGAK